MIRSRTAVVLMFVGGCKAAQQSPDAARDVPAPDNAPDPKPDKAKEPTDELSICCEFPTHPPSCKTPTGGTRLPNGDCPLIWDAAAVAENMTKKIDRNGCLYWEFGRLSCLGYRDPSQEREAGSEGSMEVGPDETFEKPCAETCPLGGKRCGPTGGVQTCAPDAKTTCPTWGPEACSTACTGMLPDWCKTCAPPPAECAGITTFPATVCAESRKLATCRKVGGSCVESTITVCTYPQICVGPAGAKVCACAPDQTDPTFDPKTRHVPGTGCTAAERDSKDPHVSTACDPVSGQIVHCESLGSGATACNEWVAQPPCGSKSTCTTDGTNPDGSPVTAAHCS